MNIKVGSRITFDLDDSVISGVVTLVSPNRYFVMAKTSREESGGYDCMQVPMDCILAVEWE